MTTPRVVFSETEKTVIFLDRETIDDSVKSSGVNTLRGFNLLARAIVDLIGPERGVSIKEGEESMWALGALSRDDVEYLNTFLKPGEGAMVVDLIKTVTP